MPKAVQIFAAVKFSLQRVSTDLVWTIPCKSLQLVRREGNKKESDLCTTIEYEHPKSN
jgi:hypothetical protein